MEEQKSGNGAVMWGVAVVVIALLAFGGYKYMNKGDAPEVVTLPNANDTTVNVASLLYKDGAYSATGSYVSPAGEESIVVDLTIKGDTVSDVTVTSQATRRESKEWQGKFISGVKAQIVGKKINEIALTKVSGSSLTPKGFMDALAKIKVQAKA